MEVRFKKAEETDIEEIIRLCNECFQEQTDIEYAQTIFEQTKQDPNQIYLVGIVEDHIIAHAKITIIPTMYKPMQTYSILNHVCVKPDYRRHGIATKMLDEIKKICKENNCVKIELWSNNVRTAAHACYHNYGFHLDEAGFFSYEINE